MLIKTADCKQASLDTLQSLLERPDLTPTQRKAIVNELDIMKAAIKRENEATHDIDFHFKDHKNYIVLHDLRLEINGRIAQIDHILLDRTLIAYIVETKHFNTDIKINEKSEFSRWNHHEKIFEGIPSPIAKNECHSVVLDDFFKKSDMPRRLGMKLIPKAECFVLVSNNASIDRPHTIDTSRVIKSDAFTNAITTTLNAMKTADTVRAVSRLVSHKTLETIGHRLKDAHKPNSINYLAKFGLSPLEPKRALVTYLKTHISQ